MLPGLGGSIQFTRGNVIAESVYLVVSPPEAAVFGVEVHSYAVSGTLGKHFTL